MRINLILRTVKINKKLPSLKIFTRKSFVYVGPEPNQFKYPFLLVFIISEIMIKFRGIKNLINQKLL